MISSHRIALARITAKDNYLIPLGLACLQAYLKRSGYLIDTYDIKGNYAMEPILSDPFQQSFIPRFIMNHNEFPLILAMTDEILVGTLPDLSTEFFKNLMLDYAIRMFESFDSIKNRTKNKLEIARSCVFRLISYKIVGFSLDYTNVGETILTSVFLKQLNPDMQIIWGGPTVTMSYPHLTRFLKRKIVDVLVIGEGEETLKQIIDAYSEQKTYDSIAGVVTETSQWKSPRILLNLDSLPTPDYTGIDLSNYNGAISIYATRGCINRCSFCAEWSILGNEFRKRSPEIIVKDIAAVIENYHPKYIIFGDSLVNPNPEYINRLADLILEAKIECMFIAQFRADFSQELAYKLYKVGFREISVGFEAFDEEELTQMKKNRTLKNNISTIEVLGNAQILIHAMFIIGFGKPMVEIRNLMAILKIMDDFSSKHYNIDWRPSFMSLLPGSNLMSDSQWEIDYSRWEPLYKSQEKRCENLVVELKDLPYEQIRKTPDNIITGIIHNIREKAKALSKIRFDAIHAQIDTKSHNSKDTTSIIPFEENNAI